MAIKNLKAYIFILAFISVGYSSLGQGTVPYGIHYQAVARDNFGKELADKVIDVRFSIISENPLGTLAYQELHSKVKTSKYGVFTLIVGHGTPTGGIYGELSQINWPQAFHYLKVEVKFESQFMDMGTMQFLAVPYALYAQKSLEPGPTGPKGDQGDPASDDQTLSFNGNNLTISGGNTVNLSTLNVPHSLSVTGNKLSILGGNEVTFPDQIQNLSLGMDNKLAISGGNSVDLTPLKNDADADPGNEIQTISYDADNSQLTLSKGGGSVTIGQIVAFRAGIASSVNLTNNTAVDLVFDQISGNNYYNDGSFYNSGSGGFQAPFSGIYTFSVSINLPTNSSLIIEVAGVPYETIIGPTNTSSGFFKESITMKLNKNDIVNAAVLQTNGYLIPFPFSGYFSGYRVY